MKKILGWFTEKTYTRIDMVGFLGGFALVLYGREGLAMVWLIICMFIMQSYGRK